MSFKLDIIKMLRERASESYTCECGVTIRKDSKARHERSKFHIYYTNQQCLI